MIRDLIPSPCISICKMNPKSELCTGCHRSIDEIANWSARSDAEKLAILERIGQRTQQATQEHH
jgi:predicted Fe-S protein YdhL (DUF1289 family)